MERKPNKSVLLITKCCGKGFHQAQVLIKALNEVGLIYELAVGNARNSAQVLERFDIHVDTLKRYPIIYVDDLCFRAEKINDKDYLKKLVNNLVICNCNANNK